jgi:hypothetical protein
MNRNEWPIFLCAVIFVAWLLLTACCVIVATAAEPEPKPREYAAGPRVDGYERAEQY